MKTTFKYEFQHQAMARQKQFEQSTGVKWSYSPSGDGYRFSPVITRATTPNEDAGQILYPFLDGQYRSFLYLAQISNLELSQVLSGAKWLTLNQFAVPTIDRMGGWNGVRKA